MDEDRTKGAPKRANGQVRETAGNMTGDTKTYAEGMYDKAEGKLQNADAGSKDKTRDALGDK
jgi:uncharacterized protein YjbJ (UPF0337 family)